MKNSKGKKQEKDQKPSKSVEKAKPENRELDEKELDGVSGGLNPQPLPPRIFPHV